jgi:RND superfamily putative drug exporter
VSWYLYRLGRWSFRHRFPVLAFWLALLVLAGVGGATLSGKTVDQFTLPGIESVKAFDLIKERSPQSSPDGATARIVFQAPKGATLKEEKSLVKGTLDKIRSKHVAATVGPFESGQISKDGRTGIATVSYTKQANELSSSDTGALERAPTEARAAGMRVEIGGDALQQVPDTGSNEALGVIVALFVLLITFGSLLAAGMPLVTALIGVGIGVSGISIATGFLTLGSTAPILATMLGLAVGIDYALFIVSRYRHEVTIGREPEEAAGRAVGTAGSAVVFAGLTVVIALVGLSVVRINFLTQMGIAAAVTVLVAVLIALTLLPALCGIVRLRIMAGKIPFLRGRDPEDGSGRPTNGRRWADFVTTHRIPTFLTGLVVAGVVAFPVASMNLALPDDSTAKAGSGPREAFDLIAKNFGPGLNGPLVVVVDTKGVGVPADAVAAVTRTLESDRTGIASVVPAVPADASAGQKAAFEKQLEATQLATLTVIPTGGPSDVSTQDLVDRLRTEVDGVEASTGTRVLVTGQTALGVDVSESLSNAFPRYLLVVVGLAFILLTVVFRSVVVPLKAMVGFLLSVLMALGATVAVFQWGWLASLIGVSQTSPVLSLLPLLLTGILFGLSMDYEVFLVSRMREEYVHGRPAREAVVHGFQYGARVVTAAAAIMIGVFGGFALGDDAIVKSIGFGLAFGILADAFLVRMTLVPAFMALLGDRMWWLPRWLDRAIPNLDIEGEALAQHTADVGARHRREMAAVGR